jgi:hypothetical protein
VRGVKVKSVYFTGELNDASPRFASAQAHQIWILATFYT